MTISTDVLKQDERAVFGLRSLYRSYGYAQFKMSKFEEYDLYVRNKSFLVSDHIITFTDTNGKLMALKPDVTLSIVKNTKDIPNGVQKVYYDENVYRVSGGYSSYREIMQAGLECIGNVDDYCIAEVLTLAVESLAQISPDFVLDISHLGILSAVLDAIPVSDEGRTKLLQAVGQKNVHGVDEICNAEGLDPSAASALKSLIGGYGSPRDVLKKLNTTFANEPEILSMLAELETVLAALPAENIRIDFSVVNDLGYYNGIVFNGFIKGITQSILSGGQYDNLLRKMGRKSGAIGFAIYLDLLAELAPTQSAYDVDAVLLYDPDTDVTALTKAVRALTRAGKTVSAQRTLPEKLRYRELLKLTEKGVEQIETNA